MTAKEKAIELIHKFSSTTEGYYKSKKNLRNAKQCTLIAIDEIIRSRKDDTDFDDTLWASGSDMYSIHPMYLTYWKEVKKEIEKL